MRNDSNKGVIVEFNFHREWSLRCTLVWHSTVSSFHFPPFQQWTRWHRVWYFCFSVVFQIALFPLPTYMYSKTDCEALTKCMSNLGGHMQDALVDLHHFSKETMKKFYDTVCGYVYVLISRHGHKKWETKNTTVGIKFNILSIIVEIVKTDTPSTHIYMTVLFPDLLQALQ